MSALSGDNQDTPPLSTGSLALDWKLGTGGWPRGRIIELLGPEGAGKTTLALEAIAHLQQTGGVGALIDADHATDPESPQGQAWRLGVDPEAMPFYRPTSLEDAFEKIEELVQGGADLIVLDSIGALQPRALQSCERNRVEQAKNTSHQHWINHCLKVLAGQLARTRTTLLITNYVVERVGVLFGNPESIPWVTAPMRYHASQRVEIRSSTTIREGETVVGVVLKAKVIKNRLAPPFRQTTIELYFAHGISAEAELLEVGVESRVLSKNGSRYSYNGKSLGNGREQAMLTLRQDAHLATEIRSQILQQPVLK